MLSKNRPNKRDDNSSNVQVGIDIILCRLPGIDNLHAMVLLWHRSEREVIPRQRCLRVAQYSAVLEVMMRDSKVSTRPASQCVTHFVAKVVCQFRLSCISEA